MEVLKYGGLFFNIYIDKNNGVHHLERSEVTAWKEIVKGKRKIRVPETCETFPEPELLNKYAEMRTRLQFNDLRLKFQKEHLTFLNLGFQ